jgi:hypothetical protein
VRARRAALPTLDIAEGALDRVFEIYKRLLPGLGGYLTHAGELDQRRLERLLAELGALELDVLQQRAEVRARLGYERQGQGGAQGHGEALPPPSCLCVTGALDAGDVLQQRVEVRARLGFERQGQGRAPPLYSCL